MAKPTTHISDLTLNFGPGPVSARGRLIGVCANDEGIEGKIRYASPDGVNSVTRFYRDDVTGEEYDESELGRRIEAKRSSTPLDVEQLAEARKADLPLNILNINVHRMSDVQDLLIPAKTGAYLFEPGRMVSKNWRRDDPESENYAALIAHAIQDPNLAFIGLANIRHSQGIFQLRPWRGMITVRRVYYFEDIFDFDTTYMELDDRLKGIIDAQVPEFAVPFDAESYADTRRPRIAQVGPPSSDKKIERTDPVAAFDLEAALLGKK